METAIEEMRLGRKFAGNLLVDSQAEPALGREDLIAFADDWLVEVLRGEENRWRAFDAYPDWDELVLQRIDFHGIGVMLAERRGALEGWPDPVIHAVRDLAVDRAMWEMVHKITVSEAIDALAQRNVRAIVLKGTALAYTLFERPVHRLRGDTDLLVPAEDVAVAEEVLAGLGYENISPTDEMPGELEAHWQIAGPEGTVHAIDLHYSATALPALEGVLPWEDCDARAVPLPELGEGARRLDHPHMLLHAAVHRAKHEVTPYRAGDQVYHDGDRLIWVYDFSLLARALDKAGWDRFVADAHRYGVAPICAEALDTARRRFITPVPPSVMERLREPQPQSPETRFLQERQLGRSIRNFRAQEGLVAKAGFLRSKLLPSAAFMREKYPQHAAKPLPLLYLWRVAELFIPRPREKSR